MFPEETSPALTSEGFSLSSGDRGNRRRLRAALLAVVTAACGGAAAFAATACALGAPAFGEVSSHVSAFATSTPIDTKEFVAVNTFVTHTILPMMGVPGRHFANYGAGMRWQGFITKSQGWLAGARERAAVDPTGVIILMDTDIFNGGCADDVLRERYQRIVRASGGASVVMGADLHQYPDDVPWARDRLLGPAFQARRAAVLADFGMKTTVFNGWTLPHPGATSFSFVNSGFMMGPAETVIKVLQCGMFYGWDSGHRKYDDQRGLSVCAAKYPRSITIDYAGALVIATYTFKTGFLQPSPAGVQNMLLGDDETQCFVHLNGHTMPDARMWYAWYARLKAFLGSVGG